MTANGAAPRQESGFKEFDAALGAWIRKRRERLGMRTADLAEVLTEVSGVKFHKTTVHRIEIGGRVVKLSEVFVLAEALEVDPMMLFVEAKKIDQVERTFARLTG